MEHNHINNHICNNNHKRMERNYCGRMENEIMPRREDDCNFDDKLSNHLDYYKDKHYCDNCTNKCRNDRGGDVYVLNVEKSAYKNRNFRESVWTGAYLQMTLMSIPCSDDIGVEIHEDTDQYIRIEHGYALLITGDACDCMNNRKKLCKGDAVFIPAGTRHNIVNIGRDDLKLSSVYAPPHHPKCTEQRYK